MKKVLSMVMILILTLGICNITVFAAEDAVTVYVTIFDANGDLVLTQEAITVTDTDDDGKLTVNDALYAAHEANYEGGAAAGYASVQSDYGLSLNKLWGTANGGSYGYYVNNASAMGLTETVKEGDYVNAYVYTDLVTWSDIYCYFDANTVSAKAGEEITLTLSAAGYDASWNPVVLPVEGATITVNGAATSYKTDAKGKATIQIEEAGTCVISATSQTQTLVPPVCVLTVAEDAANEPNSNTGDGNEVIIYAIVAVVALVILVVLFLTRKKPDEK